MPVLSSLSSKMVVNFLSEATLADSSLFPRQFQTTHLLKLVGQTSTNAELIFLVLQHVHVLRTRSSLLCVNVVLQKGGRLTSIETEFLSHGTAVIARQASTCQPVSIEPPGPCLAISRGESPWSLRLLIKDPVMVACNGYQFVRNSDHILTSHKPPGSELLLLTY